MRAHARVVSMPKTGLALLDAGKRDVPFDEGLPVPLGVALALGGPERPLDGEVTALNNQHLPAATPARRSSPWGRGHARAVPSLHGFRQVAGRPMVNCATGAGARGRGDVLLSARAGTAAEQPPRPRS